MATKARTEKTTEEIENEIKPITLTFTDTNQQYILEFDRNTVKMAERNGFPLTPFNQDKIIEEMDMELIEQLFYYSFQKNNRGIAKSITDDILYNELGGVSVELLVRLVELYMLPYMTLITSKEDSAKNSKVVIDF